jgi:hypothetical protein
LFTEPAGSLQPSPSSSQVIILPSLQPSNSSDGASQDKRSQPNNDDSTFDNYCLVAIAAILAVGVVLCVILAGWCYIRPSKNHRQNLENNGIYIQDIVDQHPTLIHS